MLNGGRCAPQYLQICKKIGQKAAMLEGVWQQYFLGPFFTPPPTEDVLAHHWPEGLPTEKLFEVTPSKTLENTLLQDGM